MILDCPWLVRQRYPVYLCISGKLGYLPGDPLQQNLFHLAVIPQTAPVTVQIILRRDVFPIGTVQYSQHDQIGAAFACNHHLFE